MSSFSKRTEDGGLTARYNPPSQMGLSSSNPPLMQYPGKLANDNDKSDTYPGVDVIQPSPDEEPLHKLARAPTWRNLGALSLPEDNSSREPTPESRYTPYVPTKERVHAIGEIISKKLHRPDSAMHPVVPPRPTRKTAKRVEILPSPTEKSEYHGSIYSSHDGSEEEKGSKLSHPMASGIWIPYVRTPSPVRSDLDAVDPDPKSSSYPPHTTITVHSNIDIDSDAENDSGSKTPSFTGVLDKHSQTYYETGEGVGDIERLTSGPAGLPGPRRFSAFNDLYDELDMCAHMLLGEKEYGSSGESRRAGKVPDWNKCRCGRQLVPSTVRFHFVLSRGGKVSYKYPSVRYRNPAYMGVNNHTIEDDWLVQEMQKVYKSYTGSFFFFLHMRRISYANIIRMENLVIDFNDDEVEISKPRLRYPYPCVTLRTGFMEGLHGRSREIFQRHFRHPKEVNLAAHSRIWLARLDKIVKEVGGNARFVIELEEDWNFWFFFALLTLSIALSVMATVLYKHYTQDTSSALALGSYIVTCLALLLALFAVGDYIGLHKTKDDSGFEYNSKEGEFKTVRGKSLRKQVDIRTMEKIKASLERGDKRVLRERGAR